MPRRRRRRWKGGGLLPNSADKGDIAALRTGIKASIAELKNISVLIEQRMAIRFGGMLVVAVSVLLAAFRYLGH